MSTHVFYLGGLTPSLFASTLDSLAAKIRDKAPDATILFGRGMSGAMVIPALAAQMNLAWAILRKEDDNSHSSKRAEISHIDSTRPAKAVFVDDLIDSGDTFRECMEALLDAFDREGREVEVVGAALYMVSVDDEQDGIPTWGAEIR